jgi:hypothetical protein
LLTALAGPKYPDASTNRELFTAREQYLAMAPENAEAWYLMADQIFHFGAAMGMADWEERALAGFRKAMELDSLYLPGYNHALPLAPSLGDTEFTNRAFRLHARADTATFWRRQHDWYMAARAGDAEAAANALNVTGQMREGLLQGVLRHVQFDGTGAIYGQRAIEEIVRSAPTEAVRRGRSRYAHDIMLNLGRPADAVRYLNGSKDSANDLNVRIILVRDAIVGEGSRALGDEAARALSVIEAGPEPSDSAERQIHRAVVRVLEPYRLMKGDTSQTRRSLARLRSIMRTSPPDQLSQSELEIAYIEMLHAGVANTPALRAATERVDSMLLDQNFGAVHTGRTTQHAVATAHMWERLGEPKRALAAVLRYSTWNTEVMPYLGTQVREIGRLAAAAGERKRAIRSYTHYLGLRSLAEPALKAQVDSVRRELAALESRGQ